jgi:hypothetical protein
VDPFTLFLIGGAAVKFLGGIFQGRAAKRAGKAEGERLDFNADVSELQAADALGRGYEATSRQRSLTRQVIGQQRAGFAGQNVDVTVGSAVDVQADAALLGELDAQQIQQNAEREAWGYQVGALDQRFAAENARKNGNAAGNAAYFGAVGTLMTDTALMADKYGWGKPKPQAPTTGVYRPAA